MCFKMKSDFYKVFFRTPTNKEKSANFSKRGFIYKQDLALNNPQVLICYKTLLYQTVYKLMINIELLALDNNTWNRLTKFNKQMSSLKNNVISFLQTFRLTYIYIYIYILYT